MFMKFINSRGLSAIIFCQRLDFLRFPFISHPQFFVCQAVRTRGEQSHAILQRTRASRKGCCGASHFTRMIFNAHANCARAIRGKQPQRKINEAPWITYEGEKCGKKKARERGGKCSGKRVWMNNVRESEMTRERSHGRKEIPICRALHLS